MRHFSTLLAAILVAPLSWLLLAAGQDRSARAFAGPLAAGDLFRPALCLAGAGLLLGLLATLRISPLGAALAGTAYSVSYLAVLADPQGVLGAVPQRLSLAGRSVDLVAPLRTGTALLLGALLLVATFSAGRWRRPVPVRRGPGLPVSMRAGERAPAGDDWAGADAEDDWGTGTGVEGDRRAGAGAEDDWGTGTGVEGDRRAGAGAEGGWRAGADGEGDYGPGERNRREPGHTVRAPADEPGWDGGPERDDPEGPRLEERPGQHRADPGPRAERNRTGNRRPGPYDSVNNAGDRWVGNKQPAWPYPEHPRAGSGTLWD